jgi:uncharacterized phiE125 gp8 family phage protein
MVSVVITPSELVALQAADVRQQCRIDDTAEDQYIDQVLIPAVCALFEERTQCKLFNAICEDRLPAWPRTGRIDLGFGVVRSVQSITYLDADGVSQVLDASAYQALPDAVPGEVHLAPGQSAPTMLAHPAALRVRYVAGVAVAPASLPRDVRLWLLLHVAHFWTNREAGQSAKLEPLLHADGLISAYLRNPI